MSSQFMRMQAYGFKTSGKKKVITHIRGEALRIKSYCRHVETPFPPTIIAERLGPMSSISDTLRMAVKAVDKTAKVKTRKDAQLLLGVIYSFPYTTEQIIEDGSGKLFLDYLEWTDRTLKYVDRRFDIQHYGSLAHEFDEEHPHIHSWIVAKPIGGKLSLGNAHPGLESERLVTDPIQRKKAYKEAMSREQFRYWLHVGRHLGWSMVSANPKKRLNHKQAMSAKKKNEPIELPTRRTALHI